MFRFDLVVHFCDFSMKLGDVRVVSGPHAMSCMEVHLAHCQDMQHTSRFMPSCH